MLKGKLQRSVLRATTDAAMISIDGTVSEGDPGQGAADGERIPSCTSQCEKIERERNMGQIVGVERNHSRKLANRILRRCSRAARDKREAVAEVRRNERAATGRSLCSVPVKIGRVQAKTWWIRAVVSSCPTRILK